MTEFSPDREEFDKILKDTKEGGPREAGRFLAKVYVQEMELDDFKAQPTGDLPAPVNDWLTRITLDKGIGKQVRSGFRSRMSDLLDSLERSRNWEGFEGRSEAERWKEIRKG